MHVQKVVRSLGRARESRVIEAARSMECTSAVLCKLKWTQPPVSRWGGWLGVGGGVPGLWFSFFEETQTAS